MTKCQTACWTAAVVLLPIPLLADPTILGASFNIDKADCCVDYSVGVNVDVTGDSPITSVVVTHRPILSGSAGQWALAQLGPTWWWNWSPAKPLFSTGPLDGVFSVTATDDQGASTTSTDLEIPSDAELAFPNVQITLAQSGYIVTSDPVPGAEYYNLWVWDPVDRYYAHYQTVDDPADLLPMPFDDFVTGRQYNFYFMALNVMPTGRLQSTFRSYNMRTFVHMPTAALLEKLRLDVVGVGPGTSLADKVTMAQAYYVVPDVQATCAVLSAFQNEVQAQTGKKVALVLAEQLINDSGLIMAQMGCPDESGRPTTVRVGTQGNGAGQRMLPPPGLMRRPAE